LSVNFAAELRSAGPTEPFLTSAPVSEEFLTSAPVSEEFLISLPVLSLAAVAVPPRASTRARTMTVIVPLG